LKILRKDLKETFFATKFIEKGENFILTGEVDNSHLSRIEQYLEFIGLDASPKSQVRCFGEFGSWRLSINDFLTCFNYNHRLTILCLGLESGSLMFIRIKTEKNSSEYENFGKFEVHSGPVCGISSDYSNSKVFSCSLDGKCIITSLATRELLLEINLSCAPNGLILSEDLKTLYFPTEREVFTYCLGSLKETRAFQVDFLGFISCLCVSPNGFCIVGGFGGDVYVYNSDFILFQKYQVFGSVQALAYEHRLRIVVVGDSKGTLSIWDTSAKSILNWKPHDSVFAVCVENDEIFTAGKDKQLFTWKIEF
jgi:WD40 repeat protein